MKVDTPYATIRQADRSDLRAAVDVLTRAFTDDPVARWLFPGTADRKRMLPRFHDAAISHPDGELYLAGHRTGAALWLTLAAGRALHEPRPGEPGPGPGPDAAFGEAAERLRTLGEALARRHPRDEAHLYLWCMGVVGERQGGGLGTAMLRHRLTRADTDGLATYLEASSARSRAFYRRFGFTDLGAPVELPGGPSLWPMRRPPHRQDADPLEPEENRLP